jgi:hypothetical protein
MRITVEEFLHLSIIYGSKYVSSLAGMEHPKDYFNNRWLIYIILLSVTFWFKPQCLLILKPGRTNSIG